MGSCYALMGEGVYLLVGNKCGISSSPAQGLFHICPPMSRRECFRRYIVRANAQNRNKKLTEKPTSKAIETLQKSLNSSSNLTSAPPIFVKTQQLGVEEKDGLSSLQVRSDKRSFTSKNPSGVVVLFKKISRNTVRFLASFRLALGELAVIAALCAIGTLIEQGQSKEFYIQRFSEDFAFGIFNGEWVLRLCLDHVYTSPYFLGLLVLLAASLMACTSTRQLPLVKVARRWRFYSSGASISKLDFHETLQRACLDDLGALLVAERYQVFVKNSALYAFKGLAGRFAPIGVHAALLLVMGGAAFSATGGFHGSVMVPQGLNFLVGDIMYANGFLSRPPSTFDTEVHVNKFSIETYPNGQVSQFHSDLSLFDSRGREVSRKVISVNDPIRYGGFTMYQTDWGISVIQVHVDGEGPFNLVAAPLETGDNKLFGTFLPVGENGLTEAKGISMLARDLQSVIIYDSSGAFAGVRRSGSDRPITVDGIKIVIDDIIGSTGLEMKLDPGVPVVYAGFGALMLTTVISYLSHSQVWALQDGDSLVVGGKSNRRKLDFQEELDRLMNLVPEVIKVNKLENITIPVVQNETEGLTSKDILSKKEETAIF